MNSYSRAARCSVACAVVCVWLAAPSLAAGVHAGFQSDRIHVAPGDTFTVEITVRLADAPFNAFDASVRFDPPKLTFVPTSPVSAQRGPVMTNACPNTFHLFNAASDSLRITLGLLCSGVAVTGPGVTYRVKFAAGLSPGLTTLSLGPYTRFYNAGALVTPLETSGMLVEIGNVVGVGPPAAPGHALDLGPPRPSPMVGAGRLTLAFVLPASDEIGAELLDILGRRAGALDSRHFGAGPQTLVWDLPALPPGRYVVRLSARSGLAASRALVILR